MLVAYNLALMCEAQKAWVTRHAQSLQVGSCTLWHYRLSVIDPSDPKETNPLQRLVVATL